MSVGVQSESITLLDDEELDHSQVDHVSELEIPIVSVRPVPTPFENDEDLEVEEQEVEDEEAVIGPGGEVIKRGPGRPKVVRTGQRGRPQKVYHQIQEESRQPEASDIENQHPGSSGSQQTGERGTPSSAVSGQYCGGR